MRLAVGIMAVRARENRARQLLLALGGQCYAAHCSMPVLHIADDTEGPWRGWRDTLALVRSERPDATHVMIVQDDAAPCADLIAAVVTGHIPDGVACLYWDREHWASRLGPWFSSHILANCVCTVWPMAVAVDAVRWSEQRDDERWKHHDDMRLSAYLKATGQLISYPRVSLVEHDDGGESVANPTHPKHRATRFVGQEASALGAL